MAGERTREGELDMAREEFETWRSAGDDWRSAERVGEVVAKALAGPAPELWSCVFESDMRVVAGIILEREKATARRQAGYAAGMRDEGSLNDDLLLFTGACLLALGHVSDPSVCDLSGAGVSPSMAAAKVRGFWVEAFREKGFDGFEAALMADEAEQDLSRANAMAAMRASAGTPKEASGLAVAMVPIMFFKDGEPWEGEAGEKLAAGIAASLDGFGIEGYMDSGSEVGSGSWSLVKEGGDFFMRGELAVTEAFDPEVFAEELDGQLSDGWGEGASQRTVLDGTGEVSFRFGKTWAGVSPGSPAPVRKMGR